MSVVMCCKKFVYARVFVSFVIAQAQAKLTGSRPRPDNTLSVVAGTLPLLRCRSHMISRRLSWGNIWAIWSTWAGVNRKPAFREDEAAPSAPPGGAEKKYRYMK